MTGYQGFLSYPRSEKYTEELGLNPVPFALQTSYQNTILWFLRYTMTLIAVNVIYLGV